MSGCQDHHWYSLYGLSQLASAWVCSIAESGVGAPAGGSRLRQVQALRDLEPVFMRQMFLPSLIKARQQEAATLNICRTVRAGCNYATSANSANVAQITIYCSQEAKPNDCGGQPPLVPLRNNKSDIQSPGESGEKPAPVSPAYDSLRSTEIAEKTRVYDDINTKINSGISCH
jgi:hypothetical protein